MSLKAVIFDLGGVLVDSPFKEIYHYEASLEIPRGSLLDVIKRFGDSSAFAQLETSSISFPEFCKKFEDECHQCGFHNVDGQQFIHRIEKCWNKINQDMVQALTQLRKNGVLTAALTNNWYSDTDINKLHTTDSTPETLLQQYANAEKENEAYIMLNLFHVVVESRVEKLRKPDPRIYTLVCNKLGVEPEHCAYLDDMGANLKPAKSIGMHTILVRPTRDGAQNAIQELQKNFHFPLLDKSKL